MNLSSPNILSISEIKNIVKQIRPLVEEERLVLKARFRAYTPWAGGCAENTTILVADNGVIGICLPNSKGLVGRARWLGRIAVSTSLGRSLDMRVAEKPVSKLLGSLDGASLVRVLVEPEVLKDKSKIAGILDSLDRILRDSRRVKVLEEVKSLEYLSFILNKIEELVDDARNNGFALLAHNPRLRLTLMDKKEPDEIMARIPLPPPLADFTLKIYRRSTVLSDKKSLSAASMLLAATPVLAGLGAMTSRGFGRFCLEEYEFGRNFDANIDNGLLEKLTCRNLSDPRSPVIKDIEEIHSKLGNLLLKIYSTNKFVQRGSGYTPILDMRLTRATEANTNNMYEALNKIANAVTKQCWKKTAGLSPLKPGANLHTWALGLPRRQKSGGYDLVESNFKNINDIFCLSSKDKYNIDAGRRHSLIHVYPLPQNNADKKSNTNKIRIAIVVYKAYDLEHVIAKNSKQKLYHVGRYIIKYKNKNNKKIPIFSKPHYVSIRKIALTKNKIWDPCYRQGKNQQRHYEIGGILRANRSIIYPTSGNAREIIDKVLESAVYFIDKAIKNANNYGC